MDKSSISLTNCPVEAVLAEDVVNANGVIVLKAGTILSESKIVSLGKYGVECVIIEAQSSLSPEEIEAKRHNIEKIIAKRMRLCEMTDEMQSLKDALVNYQCRGLNR